MARYLLRRGGQAVLTLLGISLLVFTLVHAVPGDPALIYAGGVKAKALPPETLAAIRAEFHLDEPLPAQFVRWVGGVARFDFGTSFRERRPVRTAILERLPRTLLLNGLSLSFALLLAVPLAIASARRPGGGVDRTAGVLSFLLISVPPFWLAILLIQLFALRLQWVTVLPSVNASEVSLARLMLPVIALGAGQFAFFSRFVRSTVLEVSGQEHVRTARAKGLNESTILIRHMCRNALLPNLTILGLTVPALFSGSVIVERLFQWDGIGRLYFTSMLSRDYPMVMGLTVMAAAITLATMVLVDVLYAVLDPRVRLEGQSE